MFDSDKTNDQSVVSSIQWLDCPADVEMNAPALNRLKQISLLKQHSEEAMDDVIFVHQLCSHLAVC